MDELMAWLERHADKLRDYTLVEKCDLAMAAGFDRAIVAQYSAHVRFHKAA